MLIDDEVWSTVEHYFQAQKFDINSEEYKLIITNESPAFAKKVGRGGKLQKDWKSVMYVALCAKFKIPDFKKYLLDTGDSIIRGPLGSLLMKVRSSCFQVQEHSLF